MIWCRYKEDDENGKSFFVSITIYCVIIHSIDSEFKLISIKLWINIQLYSKLFLKKKSFNHFLSTEFPNCDLNKTLSMQHCQYFNHLFFAEREREKERMTSLLQQMPVRLVTVFTSRIMIHCYQLLIFLTGTWILSVKISSDCCSSILPTKLIQTPLNLGNTTKP